jgi:hypothetical protein
MASSLVAKAGGSQPGSQGKRPFGNIASLSNVGAIALPYWVSKALVSTSVSTESSLFEARLRYAAPVRSGTAPGALTDPEPLSPPEAFQTPQTVFLGYASSGVGWDRRL